MLGNFLKIDFIVVCFLKPLISVVFLWEMMDLVASRLDLRPAAELLGGRPGSNLFALGLFCDVICENLPYGVTYIQRPCSDAAHETRSLIRAYDICR